MSSAPRLGAIASNTTTPRMSASHAPRDSEKYIAMLSRVAAPAAPARRTEVERRSAARPSASTAPIDASAPNAFQYSNGYPSR